MLVPFRSQRLSVSLKNQYVVAERFQNAYYVLFEYCYVSSDLVRASTLSEFKGKGSSVPLGVVQALQSRRPSCATADREQRMPAGFAHSKTLAVAQYHGAFTAAFALYLSDPRNVDNDRAVNSYEFSRV